VVGGFLVAAAAVLVFGVTLAGASKPGRPWVVVNRALGAGTVLGPADLTTASMRLPSSTSALAFPQVSPVEGRTLAVAVQAGELVQAPMLVPATGATALRPVSIAVDPVSLAGLEAGALVDVLMTPASGAGSASAVAPVTVVVRGATLLAVSRPSSSLLAPSDSSDVTVGVSTLGEVESVVAAAHSGTITLVAAERSDGVGPGSAP
jgi:Flp pilus assembly protein CpaB